MPSRWTLPPSNLGRSKRLSRDRVEVNAGTHHIGMTGPEPVLERLLAEELAEKDDLDDLEDELDDLEEEASAISD